MGKIVFFAIPTSGVEPRPAAEAQEAAAAGKDARDYHGASFDFSLRLGFGSAKLEEHFQRGHRTDCRTRMSNAPELVQPALLATLGMQLPAGAKLHEGTWQLLQPEIERLFHEPGYAVAIVGTEEWLNPILAYLGQRCAEGTAIPQIAAWQLIGVDFDNGRVTMTLINRTPRPQPVAAV